MLKYAVQTPKQSIQNYKYNFPLNIFKQFEKFKSNSNKAALIHTYKQKEHI